MARTKSKKSGSKKSPKSGQNAQKKTPVKKVPLGISFKIYKKEKVCFKHLANKPCDGSCKFKHLSPADVVIYKQEKRRASRARKRLAKQQIASGKRSVGGNTVKSLQRLFSKKKKYTALFEQRALVNIAEGAKSISAKLRQFEEVPKAIPVDDANAAVAFAERLVSTTQQVIDTQQQEAVRANNDRDAACQRHSMFLKDFQQLWIDRNIFSASVGSPLTAAQSRWLDSLMSLLTAGQHDVLAVIDAFADEIGIKDTIIDHVNNMVKAKSALVQATEQQRRARRAAGMSSATF